MVTGRGRAAAAGLAVYAALLAGADNGQVRLEVGELGVADLRLRVRGHAGAALAYGARRFLPTAAAQAEVTWRVADRAVTQVAALREVHRCPARVRFGAERVGAAKLLGGRSSDADRRK